MVVIFMDDRMKKAFDETLAHIKSIENIINRLNNQVIEQDRLIDSLQIRLARAQYKIADYEKRIDEMEPYIRWCDMDL